MASLRWRVALVVAACVCGPWAGAFNVTFEEKEGVEEWSSPLESVFHLGAGTDFFHDKRLPSVDATLGTRDGVQPTLHAVRTRFPEAKQKLVDEVTITAAESA